jgi:thiosulfate reductase cytochrome b subunit
MNAPSNQPPPKPRSTEQDVAYLIFAGALLLGASQLWRLRIKPWLIDHGMLTAQGGVSTQDVVGVVLIVLPLVVLWVLFRRWVRRTLKRRLADLEEQQRSDAKQSERRPGGKRAGRGDR